jgi:hypothetical protein
MAGLLAVRRFPVRLVVVFPAATRASWVVIAVATNRNTSAACQGD